MFSLSNISTSHFLGLLSNPIPQLGNMDGLFFPNTHFNALNSINSVVSMADINRFVMALPEISNVTQFHLRLDISHCTPVYSQNDGPAFKYVLEKNDPMELNALKSSFNAINEAVYDIEDPLHPLSYAPCQKVMSELKRDIDKFCVQN